MDADLGLMDYKARFYSTVLNRFIQPDTIVPDPTNSQSWNRYSYTINNPIRYSDPDGRCVPVCPLVLIGLGTFALVASVALIGYYANPDIRDATDRVIGEVGGVVRKTKKDDERRQQRLNNLIDQLSRTFDDINKNIKFNRDYCKTHKEECIGIVISISSFIVITVYNLSTCDSNSNCTYDPEDGKLIVPSKTPTPTPTIPFNNYDPSLQNLPGAYSTPALPTVEQSQGSNGATLTPATPSYRNPLMVPY